MKEFDNTKKIVKIDNNSRSMSDIGGTNILRGLEVKSLQNTYVKGELTDIRDRSFTFLDDGITSRKYIVAYVRLRNGKEFALLEVERTGRSLSLMIFTVANFKVYKNEIEVALRGLIISSGSWMNEKITALKFESNIIKMKHTSNLMRKVILHIK